MLVLNFRHFRRRLVIQSIHLFIYSFVFSSSSSASRAIFSLLFFYFSFFPIFFSFLFYFLLFLPFLLSPIFNTFIFADSPKKKTPKPQTLITSNDDVTDRVIRSTFAINWRLWATTGPGHINNLFRQIRVRTSFSRDSARCKCTILGSLKAPITRRLLVTHLKQNLSALCRY